MSANAARPRACVVIPAHNEATVIDRCLRALAEDGLPLEVVVAANACTDDTAAIARQVPGVRVVETEVASKSTALNLGDAAGTVFPRIYLDADIELRDGAVGALVEALDTDQPRVAAPQVRFETAGSTWAVRRYYDVFTQLPYATEGLVGLGVYGVSAAGRGRFERFPDLQADDTFVQRLFAPQERMTVAGTFVVQAPRNLRSLIRVRTRIAAGNAALARHRDLSGRQEAFGPTTHGTATVLAELARRRPGLVPAALVYLGVTVAARLRAKRSPHRWHRDESTR